MPQEPRKGLNNVATPSSKPPSPTGVLDDDIRKEFLHAIHASLHDIPYTVIGGSALAEHAVSERPRMWMYLLEREYRKALRKNCWLNGHEEELYKATNGKVYQLDLTADHDVDLPFDLNRDTQVIKGARVATLAFLLSAKAHAWQTRVPFESQYAIKRQTDAEDIRFCLSLLRGSSDIDRSRLNWVYCRYFWVPFLQDNPQLERAFREAGLWTDQEDFSSSLL